MSHFVTVRLHVNLSSQGNGVVMIGPFPSRAAADKWARRIKLVAWSYSDCRYDANSHRDMGAALSAAPAAEHFALMDPTSLGVHLFERTFFGDQTLAFDTAQPEHLVRTA